jgi:death-on-curing family protein
MIENEKDRGEKMQHLPADLRHEYEFLTKNNPDIDGLQHPYINLSDAFRAYFILVHYFTDASTDEEQEKMMVGIRSIDLLASALGRQNIAFGGKQKYTDALDICATLFFGIVKNHSFNDGNKRTALLLLLYQLHLYGYYPRAPKRQFENLVLHVAEGTVETHYHKIYKKFKKQEDPIIRTLSFLLRNMTEKKDNTYHVAPTMKDFCAALEKCGVECRVENGKVKMSYTVPGKWILYPAQTYTYIIPFHGWTRTVGAKTARDALTALQIYDQFPTYQSLLEGAESMYELVDDFKEPLRRLKDK